MAVFVLYWLILVGTRPYAGFHIVDRCENFLNPLFSKDVMYKFIKYSCIINRPGGK